MSSPDRFGTWYLFEKSRLTPIKWKIYFIGASAFQLDAYRQRPIGACFKTTTLVDRFWDENSFDGLDGRLGRAVHDGQVGADPQLAVVADVGEAVHLVDD